MTVLQVLLPKRNVLFALGSATANKTRDPLISRSIWGRPDRLLCAVKPAAIKAATDKNFINMIISFLFWPTAILSHVSPKFVENRAGRQKNLETDLYTWGLNSMDFNFFSIEETAALYCLPGSKQGKTGACKV